MKSELLEYLKSKQYRTARMEEKGLKGYVMINEYAAGNEDDAYDMGQADGKQYFIAELIKNIENEDFNPKKIVKTSQMEFDLNFEDGNKFKPKAARGL